MRIVKVSFTIRFIIKQTCVVPITYFPIQTCFAPASLCAVVFAKQACCFLKTCYVVMIIILSQIILFYMINFEHTVNIICLHNALSTRRRKRNFGGKSFFLPRNGAC